MSRQKQLRLAWDALRVGSVVALGTHPLPWPCPLCTTLVKGEGHVVYEPVMVWRLFDDFTVVLQRNDTRGRRRPHTLLSFDRTEPLSEAERRMIRGELLHDIPHADFPESPVTGIGTWQFLDLVR